MILSAKKFSFYTFILLAIFQSSCVSMSIDSSKEFRIKGNILGLKNDLYFLIFFGDVKNIDPFNFTKSIKFNSFLFLLNLLKGEKLTMALFRFLLKSLIS